MRILCSFFVGLALYLTACQAPREASSWTINSPGEDLTLSVWLNAEGVPTYRLTAGTQTVLDTSLLGGYDLRDAPALHGGFKVVNSQTTDFDDTWEMPWGEQRQVRNHYRELRVELQETAAPERLMHLAFRLYDDGLGFRYEVPAQPGLDSLVILDENTHFALTADHRCWWQPGDWDIYEHLYNDTRFSEIDALSKRDHPNLAQTYIPENAVNTPVTLRTDDGLYLSFHEAALYDCSEITLRVNKENLRFESEMVGRAADNIKSVVALPFVSSWRTVQVGRRAGDLIESKLIVNLNEPNQMEDVSWVKPMKYGGIWWDMHLGTRTWEMASGKHGATTAYAKEMIDFCAANGIKGLLVEGWNTGWEHWIGFEDREGVFDFVTPYPDYDIVEVTRYGREKGVDIIMHHETSSAVRTYDQQLDTAFALCKQLGIHAVKTGYVGRIIPVGEYHHGQYMVRHYQKVLETAARYQVAVDAHEPIKDTGIRRTWPSFVSREGLRGQEFNAWSNEGGNPTDHLTLVAFTRMLAGPIDYTPGVFNLSLNPHKPDNRVKHTLAHELALYVVIYSPIQMVVDLIPNLEGQPGMQFVRDVAVDWEQTRVIDGEPGDFVVIARQERGGERWFVGAIADENGREMELALDFLPAGRSYTLTSYADGPDAHWLDNPTSLNISTVEVNSTSRIPLKLAPGGGAAWAITPQ